MKDVERAAVRGAVWSAIQQAGDRGIRIVVYLLLARLVAPDAFGVVALAGIFIELGFIVVNQGLTSAIVQREELTPAHLDAGFWAGIAFSMIGLVGFLSAAPVMADAARKPEIAPVIRWLSLSLPIAAASGVQEAVLRREFAYRVLAVRSFIAQVVAGILALAVALGGHGIWSLVALELGRRSVSALMLWHISSWRPARRGSLPHYLELLRFGVHVMGATLVRFLQSRSDFYLIGAFLGTTPLGYYAIARQLVGALTIVLSGSISEVMWSTFSRLQSLKDRLSKAITRSIEILATIAWPVFVGGIAVAPELVEACLGGKWAPSVPIVQAFFVCSVVGVITGSLLTAVTAVGSARLRFLLDSTLAGLTLVVIVIALRHGAVAVAWASACATVLVTPLAILATTRRISIPVRDIFRRLVLPGVACLCMFVSIQAMRVGFGSRLTDLEMLVALVATGAAVYVSALFVIAPGRVRRALDDLREVLLHG